ncbi:hypothetical protein GCM10022267_90430 [Lentzea roselyniae]|uniref:CBM6 domain-containing protein n=1 Tax=Lentzea roselyniae TaxID=531940 RepID=A0ABP7CFQ3_9PSEU
MLMHRRRATPLAAGVVALTLAGNGLVVLAASAAATRYEAEAAPATCTGSIESNHTGYSGNGFCNGDNTIDAATQFTVTASAAGTATIAIRYANGATGNRPADVLVNGALAHANTAFDPTGAWTAWATKTFAVPVHAGTNTIRLDPATAAGLANIDYLDLETGSAPPVEGKQLEDLDRGLVSVRSGSGNLVSWRMFGTEPASTGFNVYRGTTKLTSSPITRSTNFLDWDFAGEENGRITQWGRGSTNPTKKSTWGQEDYLDSRLELMRDRR